MRRFFLASLAVIVALFLMGVRSAPAQTVAQPSTDPNFKHPNEVVTVERSGYTISGLITRLQDVKSFKHGIALFPGHPGIMRLRVEEGQPRFDLRGNFLVRTRRFWLDRETIVAVIDAPSDRWRTFPQSFREGARYGADIEALLEEITRAYGVAEWTFVGTSEGSVSAVHAARMNPARARRVILTASLFRPTRDGLGLSRIKWEDLKADLLWVHHEDDPCRFTSYYDAQEFSQKSGKPLLTVRGGGPEKGEPCEAFSAHGFVGVERETVAAMLSWVKTGVVPADVNR